MPAMLGIGGACSGPVLKMTHFFVSLGHEQVLTSHFIGTTWSFNDARQVASVHSS